MMTGDLRHKTTSVRFTVEEHAELLELAAWFGFTTIAGYLRTVALNPGRLVDFTDPDTRNETTEEQAA